MPTIGGVGFTPNIGGAVSDLFKGIGFEQSAAGYQKAASIEESNAQLAGVSEKIQEQQTTRNIALAQGATTAGFAGAGLASSGSALDVLASGAQQGSLQKQIISTQGQIQVNQFEKQAEAYKSLAAQSKSAATGSFIGGALSLFGL